MRREILEGKKVCGRSRRAKKCKKGADERRSYYAKDRDKLLERVRTWKRDYYAKKRKELMNEQRRYRAESLEKMRRYRKAVACCYC